MNTPSLPNHSTASRGIILFALACLLIPCMDAIAKDLSSRYSIVQIVWARYFFHLVLLLPIVLWHYGPRFLKQANVLQQSLRGIFLLTSTWLFFAALSVVPLADAMALIFGYPLVVTALSPWLLGEAVGIRRWIAVILGFVGVLVIVRPGFSDVSVGYLLAIAASLVFAGYSLLTRKLSGHAPPMIALVFVALVGAVVTSAIVPTAWTPPSVHDWMLMASLGVIAMVGHGLIITANEYAGAAQLAPFGYLEIVTATVLGYAFFGELPAALTWLGIAIVISAGIYIAWRERLTAQTRPV